LEAWTNGVYKATLHRVVNHGRERYSIPYFAAADQDAVVGPLPQFVTSDRPAGYGELVAGEHLLSQMVRDFSYMRSRIAAGEMPRRYLPHSTVSQFERRGPMASGLGQRIAA
jgi:isopenicillin N synthase-like dioxygenase